MLLHKGSFHKTPRTEKSKGSELKKDLGSSSTVPVTLINHSISMATFLYLQMNEMDENSLASSILPVSKENL